MGLGDEPGFFGGFAGEDLVVEAFGEAAFVETGFAKTFGQADKFEDEADKTLA